MQPRRPAPAQAVGHSQEQLALITAELARELDAAARRHDSILNRAALLIAASTIIATLMGSPAVGAWHLIGLGLAVAAGAFGLVALWPQFRSVAHADKAAVERLRADTYGTLHSIAQDDREELRALHRDNLRAAQWTALGFLLLIASWVAFAAAMLLTLMTPR